MKRLQLFALALTSLSVLSLTGCSSVEPVGFLDVMDKTLDGEAILDDGPLPDRRPNMHEDPEERSGGILQWRAR